ncbi:Tat pathway signal protein [Streptomyces inusitatus]|uniref:Tat pathway signal protein n=1 Tax=Streptomyces inusitatus TaxID=68221 RepID=A0A918QEB4_9ACTN|nr:tetratricopeptide repeat protein [Streptomyces inusitatus]GGZ41902.1 Tat pathway signal protein [Streptomyces inusitatus]
MTSPEPNERLAALFIESGWTMRQLCQEVNRLGTERGTTTQYQRPSVSQWLKGHMPKASVRPLIIEALSRRLRRPITEADAGFPSTPPSSTSPGTIDGLINLGSVDAVPGRRGVIGAALFSVALTVPGWPDVVGRMEAASAASHRRIGMPDVTMVSDMTDRLGALYDDFGGRHARPMAAAFLINTVAPYLRADGPENVRKSMMSAASFLSYLTGWMAVDESLHGLAQRYYVKGLELAGASGDHLAYCHVLRGMSVQAADLGHGPTAVRLAEAASAASPTTGPRMRAFMGGQMAHSYAVAGDRTAALHSLRETERSLDVAESGTGSFGGFNYATLAYSTSQVRYAAGDVKGSVESLHAHFRLRDSTDTHVSRMRFSAMLAERQLQLGHLDAACATWSGVLDEHPTIHSGRVDRAIFGIRALLRPHLANAGAREIYERSRLALA